MMNEMKFILCFCLFIFPQLNCIVVITSERNEKPQPDAHFILPGLNLSSLENFTMCGRFNIYQFFVETNESIVDGKIKSLHNVMQGVFPGFGTFSLIRTNCMNNQTLKDTICTDLKHSLDMQWKWKHIFAWTDLHGTLNAFPTTLIPNEWNSFCMKVSKTNSVIRVNKTPPIVLRNDNYSIPFLSFDNFVFMNLERPRHHQDFLAPMYGAFTDLNVWNITLSQEDEDNWMECQLEKEGNIISWKEFGSHVQMTGLKRVNEPLESVCPKEFNHLIVANGNRDFLDTINYCNKFGSIAEISNMKAVKEVANALQNYSEFRVFTGYTDLEVEGEWVFHNTRRKLLWKNWHPNEPNSWGGNEDCITLYKTSLKFNDDSCSKKRSIQVCNMYEVMLKSTIPSHCHGLMKVIFQTFFLRGVCDDNMFLYIDLFFTPRYLSLIIQHLSFCPLCFSP